jgi:RHS repeat-associated protein
MGTTTSQNSTTVTVNGTNAQVYGDATFAATNMQRTTSYTALAADHYGRHSTNIVTVSISTNNALFQYDGNGNLTYDGLRSFAYDNENQLLQVSVAGQWSSQFTYDGRMRRRIRQEYAWQSSGWVQTNEVYYVYDGNVVIQERNINNLPATTYTRGLDLSASLEGAGGIGGLLSMTLNTEPGPLTSNSMFYHSDANGNVTMLINSSQSFVAKYLYDAFGNLLSKSGLLADVNLYRFSSKEAHLNSGLIYYLYRFYDPHLQRWPNRDPLGDFASTVYDQVPKWFTLILSDRGGYMTNPFMFVRNDPADAWDLFGLQSWIGPGYGAFGPGGVNGSGSGSGCPCPPGQSMKPTYDQAPYNGNFRKCVNDKWDHLRDTAGGVIGIIGGGIIGGGIWGGGVAGPGGFVGGAIGGGIGATITPVLQCLNQTCAP